jgi:MFS family permease
VLTAAALTWAAGSWIQGRDHAPSRSVLLTAGTAAIGIGIGVLLSAALLVPDVPVAVGVTGWALTGLGRGLSYPTLSVLTLELSAPAHQGTNSSALQIADALFAAVVLAVSGRCSRRSSTRAGSPTSQASPWPPSPPRSPCWWRGGQRGECGVTKLLYR